MTDRRSKAPSQALSIANITSSLTDSGPLWKRDDAITWRAAVAVILREHNGRTEVLLIRRAKREGDPWSGQAALPGGRTEREDSSVIETAKRETLEEIGLDLSAARMLGTLSQHPPPSRVRWAHFTVTPVVFAIEGDPTLALQAREVAEAHWVPFEVLLAGARRRLRWFRPIRRGPAILPMVFPEWRAEGLIVWGLTYGMISELLERVGAGAVRR